MQRFSLLLAATAMLRAAVSRLHISSAGRCWVQTAALHSWPAMKWLLLHWLGRLSHASRMSCQPSLQLAAVFSQLSETSMRRSCMQALGSTLLLATGMSAVTDRHCVLHMCNPLRSRFLWPCRQTLGSSCCSSTTCQPSTGWIVTSSPQLLARGGHPLRHIMCTPFTTMGELHVSLSRV